MSLIKDKKMNLKSKLLNIEFEFKKNSFTISERYNLLSLIRQNMSL